MKFRKKPVVIEAEQWVIGNRSVVLRFLGGTGEERSYDETETFRIDPNQIDHGLIIKTLEGNHMASIGDWIIKGVKGEFYPCKPDIFTATYEPVKADPISQALNEGDGVYRP